MTAVGCRNDVGGCGNDGGTRTPPYSRDQAAFLPAPRKVTPEPSAFMT